MSMLGDATVEPRLRPYRLLLGPATAGAFDSRAVTWKRIAFINQRFTL